jgi:hypothetical protein
MKTGFDIFKVAVDLGYPLYTGGASSARSAIEVFPHASAEVLRGSLAPVGVAKSVWRRAVLEAAGIDCSEMRTTDHLDAALAALTGLKFLTGDFSIVGTPGEAVLVLPIGGMPTTRYARDQSAAISRRLSPHAARRPLGDETGHTCGCGCGAPLPGVVICQVTMRSTSRGFWPRCGQAVRLPPTSFNDSDGAGSQPSPFPRRARTRPRWPCTMKQSPPGTMSSETNSSPGRGETRIKLQS